MHCTNSLSVRSKTHCSECLNMRDDFCDFIFILETTIQSSCKIEQSNKYIYYFEITLKPLTIYMFLYNSCLYISDLWLFSIKECKNYTYYLHNIKTSLSHKHTQTHRPMEYTHCPPNRDSNLIHTVPTQHRDHFSIKTDNTT
jgi:hypothetical protein